MREHERFLMKFNDNYKRFDLNMDGVVNETEFRSLVISMGVLRDQGEIEYLLHQIDPFNNQKMTYSEVVALLSSHMVQRDVDSQQQIPLLEKFVNLDNMEQMEHLSEGDQMEEGADGPEMSEEATNQLDF